LTVLVRTRPYTVPNSRPDISGPWEHAQTMRAATQEWSATVFAHNVKFARSHTSSEIDTTSNSRNSSWLLKIAPAGGEINGTHHDAVCGARTKPRILLQFQGKYPLGCTAPSPACAALTNPGAFEIHSVPPVQARVPFRGQRCPRAPDCVRESVSVLAVWGRFGGALSHAVPLSTQ
jgi:hypothetical protein